MNFFYLSSRSSSFIELKILIFSTISGVLFNEGTYILFLSFLVILLSKYSEFFLNKLCESLG